MMVEQRHSKRQWIFIMILIVLIIVTALFFARDSSVTILPEKERELPVSSRLVLKLNDQLFLTRSYLLLRPTLVAPQLETQSALVVDPYQPLPPTDFMVVNPQTGDRVILQWKDADDLGASTVKIYRSQDEGLTFEVLDTVARGEEKVVDSAVVVDRGVVYRLTSVNQEGEHSAESAEGIAGELRLGGEWWTPWVGLACVGLAWREVTPRFAVLWIAVRRSEVTPSAVPW